MADFATDAPPLLISPTATAAASSSAAASSAVDDAFEDACSICLDAFTNQNPSAVTSCKHEYHLQCILEWSQRSKECPICSQLLVLKDPASQELLAAIETEKRLRTRNASRASVTNIPHFHEDFDGEQDLYSDDSDFDERVMQHLAAAASRARYIRRRERPRSSGLGPSQVLVFSSPANVPSIPQTLGDNSSTHSITPVDSIQHLPTVVPPIANVVSNSSDNRDGPFRPRQSTSYSPSGENSSEPLSFSDSIKSKWSAASARYKESISKSTKGFKEKLLARNNSVKELSKGVQREMSAGIAGVARMIERLDLTSKRTGASSPTSDLSGATNLSFRGKGVQDNTFSEALGQKNGEFVDNDGLNASSLISDASPGRLEVSKGGH